jgi:YegS/Rv2252/BmrU family lipid kinase
MDRRTLCLIVNPSAGRGRAARLLPRVEQALRARGLRFRVERTESLPHARELARAALAAGDVAAAMGGDGLLGASGVLGVLPGGRGNDFARKLGIGPDPERACDVLADGRERQIDVAEAGGRTYLGIASAGFDSDVQDIANATTLPLGELVYVYATLRALRGWRHARWQVVVDGEAQSFDGYAVAVANSGVFGGGMYLAPEASLDDGLLDVVLTRAATKRSYLAGVPKVFKGTHVDNPDLTFLRGREITFEADRPFAAYADGDPIAQLPVTIRVVPSAIRVLAP